MAIVDTYLRLTVDRSYARYQTMTAEALKNVVVYVGTDSAAYRPFHPNDRQAARINGVGGHAGRMQPDRLSIMVGGSRPYEMPINNLSLMNVSTIAELADIVRRGALTMKVVNKGRTVGEATAQWRDDFTLSAEELRMYVINPRTVWVGETAARVAPTADNDNFVFLPLGQGSTLLLEVEDTADTTEAYTVTLYGWNESASSVVVLAELENSDGGDKMWEIDMPHLPYVVPVVTTFVRTAGVLQVRLGAKIARLA